MSRDFHQGLPGGGSVTAGFAGDDTRSHLEMNPEGDYASVIWDAGDSFDMYALDPEDGMYYSPYTTAEGGESAVFTTTYGLPEVDNYYCFTSEVSGYGDLTSQGLGVIFLTNIPVSQAATIGSPDPEADVSVALSSSPSENLFFRSATSFLKFRLGGDIVSSVKSVSVRGLSLLAGEFILGFESDGTPWSEFDSYYEASRTVTLSGDFVAGKDYYVVLGSGQQAGLTLVFSDGSGHSTTKTVSKAVDFQRGHIVDFGTINLGSSFTDDPSGEVAELYMKATAPASKPVTIVVVPDGFTEGELSDYKLLAHSGIDALFNTEPFRTYRNYFNVWVLSVASAESGANITDGHGNITTARNCYFGSKWGEENYGDMDLNESVLYDFVTTNCPDLADRSHSVNETPVLVIINDSRYGGICHSYSNGKAYCQAPFTYSGGMLGWGYPSQTAVSDSDPSAGVRDVTQEEMTELGLSYGDWRNTLVHEFGGHAFGRLGDEYWYDDVKGAVSAISAHNWPVPMSLNISAKYSSTPWSSDLLSRRASLVSSNPLYERLGTFQGGDVSPLNRWRCEKISCMIDNRFYFSVWQRELIVKRIMSLAGATFSLSDFLALDNPVDPLRDVASSPVMNPSYRTSSAVAPIMPPLPPPVLVEE